MRDLSTIFSRTKNARIKRFSASESQGLRAIEYKSLSYDINLSIIGDFLIIYQISDIFSFSFFSLPNAQFLSKIVFLWPTISSWHVDLWKTNRFDQIIDVRSRRARQSRDF